MTLMNEETRLLEIDQLTCISSPERCKPRHVIASVDAEASPAPHVSPITYHVETITACRHHGTTPLNKVLHPSAVYILPSPQLPIMRTLSEAEYASPSCAYFAHWPANSYQEVLGHTGRFPLLEGLEDLRLLAQ